MTKNRSILRLYTQGVSKKTISEKAGATRNTIKKYIRQYIAMNRPLEEVDKMSDTELEQLFLIKEQKGVSRKQPTRLQSGFFLFAELNPKGRRSLQQQGEAPICPF